MTKRSVGDSALSVILAPGDWETAGFLFIIRVFVEIKELVNFGSVEILEQIHLFLFDAVGLELVCLQVFGCWVIYVGHKTLYTGLIAVGSKLAAKHFDVRINGILSVKRVTGRVHPDERLAGLDFAQERLFVRKRQDAGRIGEDETIVLLECRGGHFLPHFLVVADVVHRERAALLSEFTQDFFRGGNGTMAKTFGHGHHEKLPGCRRLRWEQKGAEQTEQTGYNEFVFHKFNEWPGFSSQAHQGLFCTGRHSFSVNSEVVKASLTSARVPPRRQPNQRSSA